MADSSLPLGCFQFTFTIYSFKEVKSTVIFYKNRSLHFFKAPDFSKNDRLIPEIAAGAAAF